jgi:hypothetical protein
MAAAPIGTMVSGLARAAVRAAATTGQALGKGTRLADCVPRQTGAEEEGEMKCAA